MSISFVLCLTAINLASCARRALAGPVSKSEDFLGRLDRKNAIEVGHAARKRAEYEFHCPESQIEIRPIMAQGSSYRIYTYRIQACGQNAVYTCMSDSDFDDWCIREPDVVGNQ
jgi:hypothetical protein